MGAIANSYPVSYRKTASARGYQTTARVARADRYRGTATPLQQIQSSAWFRALPEGLAATLGLFGERFLDMLASEYDMSLPEKAPSSLDEPAPDAPGRQQTWSEYIVSLQGVNFDARYKFQIPTGFTQCPSPTDCCSTLGTMTFEGWSYAVTMGCVGLGCCPASGVLPNTPTNPTRRVLGINIRTVPVGRFFFAQYVNNAGTIPVTFPAPNSGGMPRPIVIPEGDIDLDGYPWQQDVNLPIYPSPWDLPLKNPGQVTAPQPLVRPAIQPEPARAPQIKPGELTVGQAVEILPNGQAVPVSPPIGFPSPPGPKEIEGKFRSKRAAAMRLLLWGATEWRDFVQALWQAIPKDARWAGRRIDDRTGAPMRGGGKATVQDMIKDIGDYLYFGGMQTDAYWKEALTQLITENLIDMIYGHGGQRGATASRLFSDASGGSLFTNRGFQTGSGYWPKPNLKELGGQSPSDWIANQVRPYVNALF